MHLPLVSLFLFFVLTGDVHVSATQLLRGRAHDEAPTDTCAGFTCSGGTKLRFQPENLLCDEMVPPGCTTDVCCLRSATTPSSKAVTESDLEEELDDVKKAAKIAAGDLSAEHTDSMKAEEALKVHMAGGVVPGADREAPAPAPPAGALRSSKEVIGDRHIKSMLGGSGGDYYRQAWSGENAGDVKRGTGACTAFRRTLQCNPSGPRDPKQDKGCTQVITSEESGFCECGDFAQFAAVDCDHRPFTCEVMCLKYAIVSGRQAFFHGKPLPPDQALGVLQDVMWANQTDMEAMRIMMNEVEDFMGRAIQYNKDAGQIAVNSVNKWVAAMNQSQQSDRAAAEAELAAWREKIKERPWQGLYKYGTIERNAGYQIQDTVAHVLPFDPLSYDAPADPVSGGRDSH